MTVKDGFKFGVGFVLAKAFMDVFGGALFGALFDLAKPAIDGFIEGASGRQKDQ